MIELWYGNTQPFGHLGTPQRWINILGRITNPEQLDSLHYTLNSGDPIQLSIGPDRHRLANPGDFNIEIEPKDLNKGSNTATIIATDTKGNRVTQDVEIHHTKGRTWPLPYTIDWCQTSNIQNVAQIVDGRWACTPQGVRILEPYYDRVIALGDLTWTDYEIATTVTFHSMRIPDKAKGDGGANVIHAALAVRWPGHDNDGKQPRVKWYPLGATAEFRVTPTWENCSWRILGGGNMRLESEKGCSITPDVPYRMKHRVQTLADQSAWYRVKLWDANNSEPEAWDLQMKKGPDEVQTGGALLIAHYTDLTFGNIVAVPI